MTRKDYEMIAAAIERATHSDEPLSQAALIVSELANTFKADNPRFDAEKFIRACGFVWIVR